MRKIFFLFLIIFLPINVFADSGRSTIVIDNDSARILYKNNINEKMLIASITKIMTCILTIENSNINKKIIVGDEVLNIYGTNIYIEKGEELTVKDLLYGLMLRSGNDASVVLANNIFDSEEEFILKMNEKAKEIGMENTTFNNPHGLDDDSKNYSTAYDMALLARYAYKNKIYRKIINTKRYVTKSNLKSYEWYNRMSLINDYKYCVGGKNGYTPKAGKTLVSYAKKDNMTLIIVSLDDSDIYLNHKNLYDSFFKKYTNYSIIDKDNFKVDSSLMRENVYVKESFNYPLMDNEISKISTLVEVYNNSIDKKVGNIIVKYDDKEIKRIDLYSKIKKEDKINIFKFLKELLV